MKKLLALLLALVMVFGLVACGGNDAPAATDAPAADAPAKDDAPAADAPAADGDIIPADQMEDPNMYFTQFDEPFELHTCLSIGGDAAGTLEGDDTVEDNWFTRFILDTYNIKVVYDFTANGSEEYDQKLSMAISSDTLPVAFTSGPRYVNAAAKNGQLRDLTEDYEKYVCDEIKAAYAPVEERVLNACTTDYGLTSLSGLTVTTEGVSVLMINKNWLDQCGLEPPTNLAEVEAAAKAFKDAGLAGANTVPILGPNTGILVSPFYAPSSINIGLDAVFAANGAFPGFFYTDDNGEVVYGSLTQETRDTLELLSKWYADGLLDPEIGVRTNAWDLINANTCGMFFGGWWNIGFGNPASFTNDPNADWRAYPIFNDEGKWETKLPDVTAVGRFAISADATDEEALAAIILLNSLYGERANAINTGTSEDPGLYPLRVPISAENFVDMGYQHCLDILNGKADKDMYEGDALYHELWMTATHLPEIIPEYTPGQELSAQDFVISQEDANWQAAYSWLIGNKPYATTERSKEVFPEISYFTESMEMYWTNLESAEQTMMLSIITGAQPITAFDEFVEQWYAEGGEEIMAEVKAELS